MQSYSTAAAATKYLALKRLDELRTSVSDCKTSDPGELCGTIDLASTTGSKSNLSMLSPLAEVGVSLSNKIRHLDCIHQCKLRPLCVYFPAQGSVLS